MAGNHVHDRTTQRRLLVVGFSVTVCWIAYYAWQPRPDVIGEQGTEQLSSLSSSFRQARQERREQAAHGLQLPYYAWLKSAGEKAIAANQDWVRSWMPKLAASDFSWQSLAEMAFPIAAPCVEEPQPVVQLPLPPTQPLLSAVDGVRQPFSFTLTEPPLPTKSSLAAKIATVDRFADATRGPDGDSLWRFVGQRMAQLYGGQIAPSRGGGSTIVASPPTLLRQPLLAGPLDRLAMIPPASLSPMSSSGPRLPVMEPAPWHQTLLEKSQDCFAESLARAMHTSPFVEPTSLVAMLQDLSQERECAVWAVHSLRLLQRLTDDDAPCHSFRESLGELAYQTRLADQMARQLDAQRRLPGLATRLRKARYAMWRRVSCWHVVCDMVTPPSDRLVLASATEQQGEVGPLSLQPASPMATPVEVTNLLSQIEEFEATGNEHSAAEVARLRLALATSPQPAQRALAQAIDAHYRNANVRVAIAAPMLSRLLAQEGQRVEQVRDCVQGMPVRGRATTLTRSSVALLPDPQMWRVGLQIQGQSSSTTTAEQRSVRLRTAGDTFFSARQQIVLDRHGIRTSQVAATAQTDSRLLDATTNFDPVPILGSIVRSQVESSYAARKTMASREVSAKAEQRVKQEMNRAVTQATQRMEGEFYHRVLRPLHERGLSLQPVELRTTSERLVARLLVAHPLELSAHTPRPRAPSDSWISVQLHETGFSHLAACLRLEGERLTATQLQQRLTILAPNLSPEQLAESDQTFLEFDPHQAIELKLANGQAELVLNIRELSVRGKTQRDFAVHAYYEPLVRGLEMKFVLVEGPYFEGRMRNSDRLALQTVFGCVFEQGSEINLGGALANDPRLEGLMITQLVLDDGWMGVAVGPYHANRTAQLDRYAPLR